MPVDTLSRLTTRQRGDYQTPEELARQIWATLDTSRFALVIEPTFGLGSFLRTMPAPCSADVVGWEIHREYFEVTRAALTPVQRERFRLHHGDILQASAVDLGIAADTPLLVIGNPPWVTNAEQGVLGGRNTGPKRNLKGLAGLDALTGKANYDIAEAIILHLIAMTAAFRSVQFALLVKFSVVRNLLHYLGHDPRIGGFEFHRIDTQRHFGASAEAGLLKFRRGTEPESRGVCLIRDGVGGATIGEIGLVGKQLIFDLPAYRRVAYLENRSAPRYIWRQGVKHDLRDLFELRETAEGLWNRRGESVTVEPATLFQLYKGSDVFHGRPSRFVIPLYQRDLQDTLADLPGRLPDLWAYLQRHAPDFAARKSRIYRKRPPFSLFGIGDYTYRRYKIAIGALYGEPVFRLLEPAPRLPVIDDTCYMLATDDYQEAVYLLAVLSLESSRDFLLAISYAGEKRRFSKDVLARLFLPPAGDCSAALRAELVAQWQGSGTFAPATKQALHDWRASFQMPVHQPPLFTAG
jgi:hypothetical protein